MSEKKTVDVMIRARLSIVHELPHDDSKAVDVSFGRPIDLKTEMSQKLGGCPAKASEFDLESTVHQTCAGLQVPMKFQCSYSASYLDDGDVAVVDQPPAGAVQPRLETKLLQN
ncbi:hypothetical protein F7725_014578 [Dissostichus mawsoni]|uniref:Uncharacterized protein n=1 Tax=Dissostichus mawsoni TaxID=36200 RepID=A0A7J5YWP2_DISMA|nr:hypothetical protein F7725_014578 [Dissostichus mawsoni]